MQNKSKKPEETSPTKIEENPIYLNSKKDFTPNKNDDYGYFFFPERFGITYDPLWYEKLSFFNLNTSFIILISFSSLWSIMYFKLRSDCFIFSYLLSCEWLSKLIPLIWAIGYTNGKSFFCLQSRKLVKLFCFIRLFLVLFIFLSEFFCSSRLFNK